MGVGGKSVACCEVGCFVNPGGGVLGFALIGWCVCWGDRLHRPAARGVVCIQTDVVLCFAFSMAIVMGKYRGSSPECVMPCLHPARLLLESQHEIGIHCFMYSGAEPLSRSCRCGGGGGWGAGGIFQGTPG